MAAPLWQVSQEATAGGPWWQAWQSSGALIFSTAWRSEESWQRAHSKRSWRACGNLAMAAMASGTVGARLLPDQVSRGVSWRAGVTSGVAAVAGAPGTGGGSSWWQLLQSLPLACHRWGRWQLVQVRKTSPRTLWNFVSFQARGWHPSVWQVARHWSAVFG